VLDSIGNTPLVQVDGIWAKLEYRNPSGSIKARLALYVIERAEAEGLLQPGDTIVEASSGNTGNAMSMVAAAKGHRMLVVMPDGLSRERAAISRAFGAEVISVGDFHVNAALEKVQELSSRPGFFAPQQFDSEWNVEENREWLGPEILAQLDPDVPDAFVMGVGTGGTARSTSANTSHDLTGLLRAPLWAAWKLRSLPPARACAGVLLGALRPAGSRRRIRSSGGRRARVRPVFASAGRMGPRSR
jgi:cysteine synthase